MTHIQRLIAPSLIGVCLLAFTACEQDKSMASKAEMASASQPRESTRTPSTEMASHPPAGATDCAPVRQLNDLDPRAPVPLQPMMAWHQKQNMQQHLVAIQKINGALAEDDWEAVAQASSTIESSPQMKTMCQHMGAGAPGFTQMAMEFHRRADTIGVAAHAQDTKGVLRATARTLETCTQCHASYRQEIVDADTWASRTGMDAPTPRPHH